MDDLMQTLYDHLLEKNYGGYLAQTAYAERCADRDEVGRALWERLEPEERALLEELQRAYDRTQMAELEAMFLAGFDQRGALARPHEAP